MPDSLGKQKVITCLRHLILMLFTSWIVWLQSKQSFVHFDAVALIRCLL
jgi:hypothetical protein